MSKIDILTCMAAAIYYFACVTSGLQLCFGLFVKDRRRNGVVSVLVGIIMLLMSCSAACYILSLLSVSLSVLEVIGTIVDLSLFALVAAAGYVVYSNNQPSARVLTAMSIPFIAIDLTYIFVHPVRDCMMDFSMLVLVLYYLFFGVSLFRKERLLEDLYSDPQSHTLKWIMIVTLLFFGWWLLRRIFLVDSLQQNYDLVIYLYMTVVVMLVLNKISNYSEPVSREIQEEVSCLQWGGEVMSEDIPSTLQTALVRLLEDEKIYLKHDLKVEDVIKKLGTNAKYLSKMIHDEMDTNFCGLINQYRVKEAKELLKSTDDKLAVIANSCGFNSVETFCRIFLKVTGKTPTDWRVQ